MSVRTAKKPFPVQTILHSKCLTFHATTAQNTNKRRRHRRTHEARPDGEQQTYSEEELEMEENEFGALDEESPPPSDPSNYLPQPMHTMAPASMRMGGLATSMMPPNQMMPNQHLLQQPI